MGGGNTPKYNFGNAMLMGNFSQQKTAESYAMTEMKDDAYTTPMIFESPSKFTTGGIGEK